MTEQFPAGIYYIGDLGYAELKDQSRHSGVLLRADHRFRKFYEVAGREATIFFSHYLAVIPVDSLARDEAGEIILNMLPGEFKPDIGYVFETFPEPFICRVENGVYHVGHLTISPQQESPNNLAV